MKWLCIGLVQGYQPYGMPMTELTGIHKDIVQVVVKFEESTNATPQTPN